MIEIRSMGLGEADRIRELDVSEEGETVYVWVEGEVAATPETWARPRWDQEDCCKRSSAIRKLMTERGAVMLGAVDGSLLVGAAIHRPHLSPGMSQLAGLWVTRSHRRKGLATRLVREVERLARRAGASSLYVSATPSGSAVGFYRSRGFRPTLAVNQELFELEPDDIHMVLELARPEEVRHENH